MFKCQLNLKLNLFKIAESWPRVVEKCVELKQVFRQADSEFVELLSEIRMGQVPQKFHLLQSRMLFPGRPRPPPLNSRRARRGRNVDTNLGGRVIEENEPTGFFGFDGKSGNLVIGGKEEQRKEKEKEKESEFGEEENESETGAESPDSIPTVLLPTRKEVARRNTQCLNALPGKVVKYFFLLILL